jgi:hypothetical protein
VPIAMTVFWGLPSWAIYSVITGVTRRPGTRARDGGTAGPGTRRILGGRLAHGETGTVTACGR